MAKKKTADIVAPTTATQGLVIETKKVLTITTPNEQVILATESKISQEANNVLKTRH